MRACLWAWRKRRLKGRNWPCWFDRGFQLSLCQDGRASTANHEVRNLGLQHVGGLELSKESPGTPKAVRGGLVHKTELGVEVGFVLVIAKRVPTSVVSAPCPKNRRLYLGSGHTMPFEAWVRRKWQPRSSRAEPRPRQPLAGRESTAEDRPHFQDVRQPQTKTDRPGRTPRLPIFMPILEPRVPSISGTLPTTRIGSLL